MGKRPAASKATRGVSKARGHVQSSSSNPKTTKFRSQYNSLSVIAKGGPSKKNEKNQKKIKSQIKDAVEGQKILKGLETVDLIMREDGPNVEGEQSSKKKKRLSNDSRSDASGGTKKSTASFASVWSNCTNASLNEFFQVWNPNLETHKDALAVIAGLSQIMTNSGTEQTDIEYVETLMNILSSSETPRDVLTGALLAVTFVLRKLPKEVLHQKFDSFYPVLKTLMETHHSSKKKTLIKSLLRCFACLTKAHPLGKEAIEANLRKSINIAIRQCKVQNKIKL